VISHAKVLYNISPAMSTKKKVLKAPIRLPKSSLIYNFHLF